MIAKRQIHKTAISAFTLFAASWALVLAMGIVADAVADLPATASGNLVAHLKGDAGVVKDGGNNVLNWQDQSGNGNDALPGIPPLWVNNAIAGKPAINFSTEWLNLPDTSASLGIASSDYEIFVAGRSSSPAIQFLTAGGGGPGVGHYELHLNGAAGARFIPSGTATPSPDTFSDIGLAGHYTDGRPHIFNPRVEGNVGKLRVNGMENGDTVSTAQSALGTVLTLGIRGNASFPLLGDQAELLVYDRSLTSSERRQVEQHLASRWDAPINVASQTQGGIAFANEVFLGGTFAAHQIDHLNNGLYGNSESWLGANTGGGGAFAGVGFDDQYDISALAFGRDAFGAFLDRASGTYWFDSTSDVFDPTSLASVNSATWTQFLEITVPDNSVASVQRKYFDFPEISDVTGVRVRLSTNVNAIDELEIFGVQPPSAAAAPEPSTLMLAALGLLSLGLVSRRRRNR